MVFVVTSMDGISRWISVHDDDSHLPDNVRSVKIDFSPGMTPDPGTSSKSVTKLLRSAATKLPQIIITCVDDPLSPEDLGLLTAAFSSTKSLIIGAWSSDVAYSCLESCLSQVNGVKEIEIAVSTRSLSNTQAEHFFEGIKTSSCIESLRLKGSHFEDDQYAGNVLLEALQRNRSLKKLNLYGLKFETETILPRIFQAAISETKIQSLSMAGGTCIDLAILLGGANTFHHIPWNVWMNVLCQEDCSLETLYLSDGIEIAGAPPDNLTVSNDDAQRNTSVSDFTFIQTNLDMTGIMQICSVFHSLVSLDICCNNISDLSPLDPLLIGGEHDLTLQNLNLQDNSGIYAQHLSEFFRKLPQMTCIRKVDFERNKQLFDFREWMGVLEDTIWRNKSLESLLLTDDSRDEHSAYYSRIDVALAMNRGGRPRVGGLTENLLPLVLERATKLSFCKSNSIRSGSIREDVIFGLLQEMVSFSLIGR